MVDRHCVHICFPCVLYYECAILNLEHAREFKPDKNIPEWLVTNTSTLLL